MKLKLPHAEAMKIAMPIFTALFPFCQSIKIAGSLRRLSPMVGDIEIVAVPKLEQVKTQADLFGASEPEMRRSADFVRYLVGLGEHVKGDLHTGRHLQFIVEGVQLDLFCPEPYDFGRILAIRTGPADYSGKVLAGGWVKRGWVGTSDGLRMKSQCEQVGKVWRCKVKNPTLPPFFDTEERFYQFIGREYLAPKYR